MKIFLITGGAGFIGANLARRLLHSEGAIHLIIRPGTDLFRLSELQDRLTLHSVDLENGEEIRRLLLQIKPSVIFHLAAQGVISPSNPAQMLQSNIMGTFNLLKASQEIDYEAFVHMGGSSEYGNKSGPMSEEDLIKPTTLYGFSKASSTLLSQQFSLEHNKPITLLRPFSVYGPFESMLRLIPKTIAAAFSGATLPLTSAGFARDYIFVDDVVEACILSSQKPQKGEIINIGTGVQTTNERVVELIETLSGRKINCNRGAFPPRLSDKPIWVADNRKAKKLLGWEPKYTLEQGLKKTITHYESTLHHSCSTCLSE